jgi:hypothetical protein
MGLRLQDWFILALIIFSAGLYWLRQNKKSRIYARKTRCTDTAALQYLEEAGCTVIQVKPVVKVEMDVQEKTHAFELRSDFLVSRKGKRYLVHVRRGGKPVRLHSKIWRSALLRDVLVFGVAGVLVLDTERGSLQQVHFRM